MLASQAAVLGTGVPDEGVLDAEALAAVAAAEAVAEAVAGGGKVSAATGRWGRGHWYW